MFLVDGDAYIFRDEYIKGKDEGGTDAGKALHDTLRLELSTMDLDRCSIMTNVYANLAGLSKTLAHTGLVGADKRSLAPFFAGFTRSNALFSFVDAGDRTDS